MSTNLVLSTRARPLERALQGLDKLFVTHRTIGLTVALVVTTHFLLVPKSVGYVPSKPFGYTTIALLLTAIFVASAPRFPWRRLVPLKYQTWKLTHRFMGAVVALAVTHSLYAHTYVKQTPLLAVYVYGIAALGLSAWIFREFAFRRFGPFHTFAVDRCRALEAHVAEVTLAAPSSEFARCAGQFVFVSFEKGPSQEQHPFTVSSGPGRPLRLSIKASGDFTDRLQSCVPVGSAISVEGPYGAFESTRGGSHQLWLAGGIGITPFLAMAEALPQSTHVVLVWSVRDHSEAIYEAELIRLSAEKPNLRLTIHPTAELGHLDVRAIEIDGDVREYSIFICGPVAMRKVLLSQVRALGVPRSQLHFEEFRLR